MPTPHATPVSTYRLQVTSGLDLVEATRHLPYLRELGVSWVYLSPLLAAEPGSDHGYDVVAHDHVDDARGGRGALEAFSARAHELEMGVLVDTVPNHVGIETPSANAWWWDLLTHGRDSRYAEAFDVDWDAGDGQVLVPVVGDGDESSIEVVTTPDDGGEPGVRYHEHRFPLAPGTSTLEEQHYRLVSWRAADDQLNYRRFFAVNTLAGIRVEVPWVFEESHAEIKSWFDDGLVDGLRVDHPDGLRDPKGYLDDLAELTGGAYVLVEKILEPGESLPADWATQGTTGYDVLGQVDRLLVAPSGEAPLDALEARLRGLPAGEVVDWAAMVHGTKRAVADGILGSEVRRIVRELPAELSTSGPVDSDTLVDAVAELLACFDVYRTYLPEGREHLDAAFAKARAARPELVDAFSALAPVLADPEQPAALRLQQTSGMVMAKGVEDCAFYRYSRLTSLNEVGGDPSEFSLSLDAFHDAMASRQRDWPLAMTCSSTHDTKRSEDVRARISVLAEMPGQWETALGHLLRLAPLPDEGFGSLLWQAIVGSWTSSDDPHLRPRLHGYAEKAMREAGDRTQWTSPDEQYEASVHAAVDAAFDHPEVAQVVTALVEATRGAGVSNALAAKLIGLTVPGVPDVYQGSELWEQSLVDPDNRRAIDFDHRREVLEGVAIDDANDKLRLVTAVLAVRRHRPELFESYTPLLASGSAADYLVAFDRGGAITLALRFPLGLQDLGGWGDTSLELPPGRWVESTTGAESSGLTPVRSLLATNSVAFLVREDD